MVKEYNIGRIAGLHLNVVPMFFAGTMVLWIVLSGIGVWLLELSISQAVLGGLVATL